MAEITYRQSTSAPIPGSTTSKNAPLTNAEMDGNIRSLVVDLGTKSTTAQLNAGIQSATDAAVAMAIALGQILGKQNG